LLTACDSIRRARPLLGTFVEIAAAGAAPDKMNRAVAAAFAAVATVHDLMSFHAAGSDVSRLNAQAWAAPVCVHPWTFQVLQTAAELHVSSVGVFDVAIAPVLQDMGLLPRPSSGGLSTLSNLSTTQAIELLPGCRIRFRQPDVRIDLGGIAKGFAVDRAIDVLRVHGIPAALVNAGGDLAAFGPSPHNVDIRDPRNPGRLICRVGLRNRAMASSGSYFDPFRSIETAGSAIIDPKDRKAGHSIAGVTVRAPSCELADALTKVVMVAGASADLLLERYQAAALVVSDDGAVQVTREFESGACLAA
jgi:thiamine biosynthesis lipoprotein